MREIRIDDQLGRRGRKQKILVFIPNKGILEFKGESIPPVLRVISEEYSQNEKWSCFVWTLYVEEEVQVKSFFQDWGVEIYFPEKTWNAVYWRIWDFFKTDEVFLSKAQIQNAIREIFPETAQRLDEEEIKFKHPLLDKLLQEQIKLSEQKEKLHKEIKIRKTQQQLKEAQEKVSKVRKVLKDNKSFSLAELQDLYNS